MRCPSPKSVVEPASIRDGDETASTPHESGVSMTDQENASERGVDMQTASRENRRHPSKATRGLTYVDDALRNAYAALQKNDLDTFLRIHRENKIRPRTDSLV